MISTQERSQIFYARVAGVIYLTAMALSIFSQVYVLNKIVTSRADETAANIGHFELLFRLGIGVDVVVFASDVVIGWAFYQLLKSVDKPLALLAAFFRVADAAILVGTTSGALMTVKLLSGADYLHAFEPNRLQSLARLFISARGFGFESGFVFLGVGSAIFAYLLFKSRYVPRFLAAWGIFASLLLSVSSLLGILSPWFLSRVSTAAMIPMFFYEIPLGLWFLVKGVKLPENVSSSAFPSAGTLG